MHNMTLKITLEDREYQFLKWLAKEDRANYNDKSTAKTEAESLLRVQIMETMQAYDWNEED